MPLLCKRPNKMVDQRAGGCGQVLARQVERMDREHAGFPSGQHPLKVDACQKGLEGEAGQHGDPEAGQSRPPQRERVIGSERAVNRDVRLVAVPEQGPFLRSEVCVGQAGVSLEVVGMLRYAPLPQVGGRGAQHRSGLAQLSRDGGRVQTAADADGDRAGRPSGDAPLPGRFDGFAPWQGCQLGRCQQAANPKVRSESGLGLSGSADTWCGERTFRTAAMSRGRVKTR